MRAGAIVRAWRAIQCGGRPLRFTVRRPTEMTFTRTFCSLATSFIALLTVSCDLQKNSEEDRALADRYFAASAAGDYETVLSLYSQQFFAKTTREQFRNLLASVHTRCGAPKIHILKGSTITSSLTDSSGQATLIYDVTYDRCRLSEVIRISKSDNGEPKILWHQLNFQAVAPEPLHAPSTA
jgi:hypothetical protein